MRTALFALLLLLPACGAGGDVFGSPGGPSVIHVRVVASLPNGWGAHYERTGADAVIEVRTDLLGSHDLLVRTLVHELGHSLGLAHGSDPTCAMYETNASGEDWSICPAEIAGANGRNASAVDAEPLLDAATLESCQMWNAALGRIQFSFVP